MTPDEHDKITGGHELVTLTKDDVGTLEVKPKSELRVVEIHCLKCQKVVGKIELPAGITEDPPHPILCADCSLRPPTAEETKVFESDTKVTGDKDKV